MNSKCSDMKLKGTARVFRRSRLAGMLSTDTLQLVSRRSLILLGQAYLRYSNHHRYQIIHIHSLRLSRAVLNHRLHGLVLLRICILLARSLLSPLDKTERPRPPSPEQTRRRSVPVFIKYNMYPYHCHLYSALTFSATQQNCSHPCRI